MRVMLGNRWLGVAWLGAVVGASVVGCDPAIKIKIETPPDALHFEISDVDLVLPTEFADGTQVASVPCGDSNGCPPALGDQEFSCVDGVCDPDALLLVLPVGDVIDFEQLNTELRQVAGNITAIRIDFVRYNVLQGDLNVTLAPVDLVWGPAQSTDLSSPGITPLGRITQWSPGLHDVDLNESGVAALSDFLVHTSRQVRMFARTELDLDPGQPLPQGAVAADLQIAITVTGRVL